jgi:hypothetical protein
LGRRVPGVLLRLLRRLRELCLSRSETIEDVRAAGY